jgi:hypothetical protein
MQIPRFHITQNVKLTAIAAVLFAAGVSRSPENGGLFLGIFLFIALAPVYLPLSPKSPESVLLHLPDSPDDQIAVLERVIARTVFFRSGPKRAVRIKLMQLYNERGRCKDAVELGRQVLIQFRMSRSLESLVHLKMGIGLKHLGRDSEARVQMQIVSQRLATPPVDALGWLVQGRLFDEGRGYDEAIAAYERIMKMPFFERKAVQRETSRRLAAACVKAGRSEESE